MNPIALKLRTRTQIFYQGVIQLTETLPRNATVSRIVPQLLDSAGSTHSNYRSACRARSKREFIAKLGVAIEECDEAQGWLESLANAGIGDPEAVKPLIKEADELVAMMTASAKTAKANLEKEEAKRRRTKRR